MSRLDKRRVLRTLKHIICPIRTNAVIIIILVLILNGQMTCLGSCKYTVWPIRTIAWLDIWRGNSIFRLTTNESTNYVSNHDGGYGHLSSLGVHTYAIQVFDCLEALHLMFSWLWMSSIFSIQKYFFPADGVKINTPIKCANAVSPLSLVGFWHPIKLERFNKSICWVVRCQN